MFLNKYRITGKHGFAQSQHGITMEGELHLKEPQRERGMLVLCTFTMFCHIHFLNIIYFCESLPSLLQSGVIWFRKACVIQHGPVSSMHW